MDFVNKQTIWVHKFIKIRFIKTKILNRIFFSGLYGGSLANLAAIVDMEMIKQEANTCEKALVRALITCKSISQQDNFEFKSNIN